jgi:hypothetical protein
MQNNEKMICPYCKVEMNFHAMKIDYTQTTNEPDSASHELGGILEEFHSCPNCGLTATREKKTE